MDLNNLLRTAVCMMTSVLSLNFNQFTEREIGKIIRSLPSNKSPFSDKVTARVLKDSLQ